MGNPVARYTLHVPRRGTFVQRVTWNLQRRSKLQRSPIRVEHVFEPHPAPVEVQIDEAGWPVAVLQDDQLGRPVHPVPRVVHLLPVQPEQDRKSTRLNSSHVAISYAVFCLKKKNTNLRL